MKITKITKKNLSKYEVVIDNKKYIIDSNVLIDMKILSPKEITKEEYLKIIDLNNYYEVYSKILKYLDFKLRSKKSIINKLKQLNVDNNISDKIIKDLYNKGLLDDNKYINSYINDQINLTLNGPNKIYLLLKKEDYDDDIINKYLDKIDNEIWLNKINKIIDKKLKTNKNSYNFFIKKIKLDLYNSGYSEQLYIDIVNNIKFNDIDNMKNDYNKLLKKYKDNEYIIKNKLISLGYDISKYNELI